MLKQHKTPQAVINLVLLNNEDTNKEGDKIKAIPNPRMAKRNNSM